MKGIIFNLLEDFIVSRYGENTYEEIIAATDTGSLDPFEIVGPGSYPDEVFTAILQASARKTGAPIPDMLREMGRHSLPILAQRYPRFFKPYSHPRDFLKTASMIHHVEVKKLYQGAEVPNFFIHDEKPDGFTITYKSRRRLCHLVEGLIAGLGDHYHNSVTIDHLECQLKGDANCNLRIHFN